MSALRRDESLRVLVHTEYPAEADTIVALLRANGIDAYAAHRDLEDVFPALFSESGTAVVVRDTDLDTARAFLDAAPCDDAGDPGDAGRSAGDRERP